MSLTFANFKKVIPSHILTRGRNYLRAGQILDLTFDDDEMLWEAQVKGSEVYEVRVEQKSSGHLLCSCTCPYDMGEHCKHVAAVLYAIEDAFPEQVGAKPRAKAGKRQTRQDKLRLGLEKATREQLVTILLEMSAQDREILNQLLVRLDTGSARPMDYRRLVKDALRSGRGDYGFLDYTGSRRAGGKVGDLLTQANLWRDAGEYAKAVGVYQAVIDEVVAVIEQADDSAGDLSDCVYLAIEGLTTALPLADRAGQEGAFNYYLERAQLHRFYGWDWGWVLLDAALELVDTAERRARFEAALDVIGAETRRSERDYLIDHYQEKIILLRLALIERFDGEAAAREFMKAHLDLNQVRKMLIERAINEGALAEAESLIQDGVTSSGRQGRSGWTVEYRRVQLKLLQATGDQEALIDAARALWTERGGDDIFALLKQTVPVTQWRDIFGQMVVDLQRNPYQLAWLYAQEGRWKELVVLAQDSPEGAQILETWRGPLEPRFPHEVALLYSGIAVALLANASGRSHYHQVVTYLRRIKKMGLEAQAEALAQKMRAQYPNRPALLDELHKL